MKLAAALFLIAIVAACASSTEPLPPIKKPIDPSACQPGRYCADSNAWKPLIPAACRLARPDSMPVADVQCRLARRP